jgi:hypothetical protein
MQASNRKQRKVKVRVRELQGPKREQQGISARKLIPWQQGVKRSLRAVSLTLHFVDNNRRKRRLQSFVHIIPYTVKRLGFSPYGENHKL